MPAQLMAWLRGLLRTLLLVLSTAAVLGVRALGALWRGVRPALIFALNVLVALLLLFEEWGWRPLSNLLAQLARFRIWAMVELWIAGLPPYGALAALAVPSTILIPAKLIGLYLLATGHVVTAGAVILLAKLAGTALVARIFILTKPALMEIGWFQRAYDAFMPWQEALFARIRGSWVWRSGRVARRRAAAFLRGAWARLRPRAEAAWERLRPGAIALVQRLRAAGLNTLRRAAIVGRRALDRLESLANLKRR